MQLHQQQPAGQPQPVRTVDALATFITTITSYSERPEGVVEPEYQGYQRLERRLSDGWPSGARYCRPDKQRGENRYTYLKTAASPVCRALMHWSVVGSKKLSMTAKSRLPKSGTRALSLVPSYFCSLVYSPYLQLPVGDKRRLFGFLISTPNTAPKMALIHCLITGISPNFDADYAALHE